jgi:hypothetical protein
MKKEIAAANASHDHEEAISEARALSPAPASNMLGLLKVVFLAKGQGYVCPADPFEGLTI